MLTVETNHLDFLWIERIDIPYMFTLGLKHVETCVK